MVRTSQSNVSCIYNCFLAHPSLADCFTVGCGRSLNRFKRLCCREWGQQQLEPSSDLVWVSPGKSRRRQTSCAGAVIARRRAGLKPVIRLGPSDRQWRSPPLQYSKESLLKLLPINKVEFNDDTFADARCTKSLEQPSSWWSPFWVSQSYSKPSVHRDLLCWGLWCRKEA